ncbi:S-methyl-5'-thioadenosine phosphorylase [Catenuloplanes japonicus]|uniref:S-methyl-5'-thioadenosine phosphorylase n=1 Tax=Catenuloplanes japonicus TaxID=33876 RepID=UPI000A11846A|nr:S-methyl-5'-thioadenosine phosphorylase [Catenuloplanes japonicus]
MSERNDYPTEPEAPHADVAVIGGSGLYALLDNASEHVINTPYGLPSDAITIAEIGGRKIAFLPRHGKDHRFPPHKIPYRANMWALRSLGVRQVLAPCAVGGLRPELGPGTFVVPDQLIDRTSGRVQTYYDEGAVHLAFADPYCPTGRELVLAEATQQRLNPVSGGTMVVVEGPRFSTRAESRWFTAIGGTVVNMTGHPEAVLARELELCYTSIALVTDLDAGVEAGEGVTMEEVFRVFRENTDRLRDLLLTVVTQLPEKRTCPCATALDGISLPIQLP